MLDGQVVRVRDEVRINSHDAIDLKAYEPAMRHLIDTCIRSDDSEKISVFDDLTLIQLIVERGPEAVNALPERIRKSEEAVAETIENNVRKLIINASKIKRVRLAVIDKLGWIKRQQARVERRRETLKSSALGHEV